MKTMWKKANCSSLILNINTKRIGRKEKGKKGKKKRDRKKKKLT